MRWRGLVKRVVPFVLTFALGLFVASFFVPITMSVPEMPRRTSRWQHRHHNYHRLQRENDMLRLEIERLKNENADLDKLKNLPVPPVVDSKPSIAPIGRGYGHGSGTGNGSR